MVDDVELDLLVNDLWERIGASDARRVERAITTLRADLANAGAVMVEAALRSCSHDHEAMVNKAALREALSTLSPIAAAARVLLADEAELQIVAQSIAAESGTTVDVLRHGLRALAEQEKADE